MASNVKFGVTYASAEQAMGMREFGPFVERLGLDSVWCNDHIVWRRPLFDCMTVLAAFAATTERIAIGAGVLILPLRNPTLLAKQVATLDILADGRLLFGIGVGGEYPKEFEACGIAMKERGRRADEAIELMRRLWTAERVSVAGRFYQFDDVTMAPPPVQRPHPPLWIGGRAEPSLRRAARYGDVFFPYLIAPESYGPRLEQVQHFALEYGRDPAAIEAAHMLHIYAGKSREQARDTAAASILRNYDFSMDVLAVLDKFCAYGTPADCAARLEQYVAAGARHFVFEPLCPSEEMLEQIEVLAKEVAPHVGV